MESALRCTWRFIAQQAYQTQVIAYYIKWSSFTEPLHWNSFTAWRASPNLDRRIEMYPAIVRIVVWYLELLILRPISRLESSEFISGISLIWLGEWRHLAQRYHMSHCATLWTLLSTTPLIEKLSLTSLYVNVQRVLWPFCHSSHSSSQTNWSNEIETNLM